MASHPPSADHLVHQVVFQLRHVGYKQEIPHEALLSGESSAFLVILHYLLLRMSPHVGEWIVHGGFHIPPKPSARQAEAIFRVLQQAFSHRPLLSLQQFQATGFSARKAELVMQVFALVREKHGELIMAASRADAQRTSVPIPAQFAPKTTEVTSVGVGSRLFSPQKIALPVPVSPQFEITPQKRPAQPVPLDSSLDDSHDVSHDTSYDIPASLSQPRHADVGPTGPDLSGVISSLDALVSAVHNLTARVGLLDTRLSVVEGWARSRDARSKREM